MRGKSGWSGSFSKTSRAAASTSVRVPGCVVRRRRRRAEGSAERARTWSVYRNSDCERAQNGLMTYDRKLLKFKLRRLAALHCELIEVGK
jgi:hypothetical protein